MRQSSAALARFCVKWTSKGVELPSAILAVRLLNLTGCHLNEIMLLKWEYVEFTDRVLRLPASKTGAKVVHLGRPAIDLLKATDRIEDNPWVILVLWKGST